MNAGVALSGSGSTYKENLIRQEGTSSLADKTPSSHERPQSKVEAASQGLQLAEHSAASMPNGECPRCYLGLCTVPCNQGPCKMRIEAERLCGDLSTVTANSRQGAAAHQHRLPALSSLGIAQRNAAKFTDGEVSRLGHKPPSQNLPQVLHLTLSRSETSYIMELSLRTVTSLYVW